MIFVSRSQELARCFVGAVAIPRSSPDWLASGDPYQADNGTGDIPNAVASLAIRISGIPSENLIRAASPAIATSAVASCFRRYSSKASRRGGVGSLGTPKMAHVMALPHELGNRQLH